MIKTTVKKYYKRFDVPDLKRANIKLNKEALSFKHANNTLIGTNATNANNDGCGEYVVLQCTPITFLLGPMPITV